VVGELKSLSKFNEMSTRTTAAAELPSQFQTAGFQAISAWR
jgi:hypothetical protein